MILKENKKNDSVVVYWAPNTVYWNMFYPEPENVLNTLFQQKNKNSGKDSFFACPAFNGKLKNTYSFNFPIECSYEWDFSNLNDVKFTPTSEIHMGFYIPRLPSINSSPQIAFNLFYLFFSEEPITASFSAPYFHKPKYMNYGAIAPGSYDISQWFRPYPSEVTFWEEKGKIKFEENEPFFYVEFQTDKKVILKRFSPTEKIIQYSDACGKSSKEMGSHKSLKERYNKFNSSKMNKLVLKEIKENIIE